jgi:formate dehydrogenase subunit beta
MFREQIGLDPEEVAGEEIEDGRLTLTLRDGTQIEKDLARLEERGYGRRENCQRCDVHIPTMADLACGKWGTNGAKRTWVETCSEKGAELLQAAIDVGAIEVEAPSVEALEARQRKDQAATDAARMRQTQDWAGLRDKSTEERLIYWTGQFEQCIKCFGCRDACPICYCAECTLEADRGLVVGGQVPPDLMFPLLRTLHVADSCVNCGQCQDVCPSELPLARLTHMLHAEIGSLLGYVPGMDLRVPPPLSTAPEQESRGYQIHYEQTRTT